MTQTMNEDAALKAELPYAYSTTDYDFATYLLALKGSDGRRSIEIVNILPHTTYTKGGSMRYAFYLASCDGMLDHAAFHQIRMDYMNQKCIIEPTALTMARRQLRSLLVTYEENARRK